MRAMSVLGKRVIRIAVEPALPRLRRRDDRMLARARVLAGVFVRRVVTAARRTALLAGAEVDPARADLHALLALPALRGLHRLDRLGVTACRFRHGCASVARCPSGPIKD